MEFTSEALKIMVVLLPGFLASSVLNLILVRRAEEGMSRVIEALVLSFIIYAVLYGTLRVSPWDVGNSSAVNSKFLIAAALMSVLLPLLIGLLVTNDLHMKLLRALRVTSRTARDTTWLDVFTDQDRYVIVNLTEGRRVFGWPMYFSNTPEEGLLYLYDPAWIDSKGEYVPIGAHGLFLVDRNRIETIEFLDLSRTNAKDRTEDADDEA
jgi:uncharacterized protein DUF6338